MKELEGFEAIDTIPDAINPNGSYKGLIEAFLSSGNSTMARTFETREECRAFTSGLNSFLYRWMRYYCSELRVARRGNTCYLLNKKLLNEDSTLCGAKGTKVVE